jgi:beta-ureidopropionase / N-carbamoyl-L-amino-acid hydrolase
LAKTARDRRHGIISAGLLARDFFMARIDGGRLMADLRELARIGAYGTGVDRIALSRQDIEARRWLVDKLRAAGLDASMDRIGNVLGRAPYAAKTILIGSHTDTVPKGGWLDGALGVAYALEIARSAAEPVQAGEPPAGEPPAGIDVISFEDEEGTYLPFLGSRSYFAGLDDAEIAAARSPDGAALAAALAPIAGEAPPHRFDPTRQVAYLEAHIEQGPRMEAAGRRIGVVTAGIGIRRFRVTGRGAANHAGTTPMAMRRDAGAAMIALAAAAQGEFRNLAGGGTVWNIGNMIFRPGAVNVVPGEAEMLCEFRDIDASVMDRLESRFLALVEAARRGAAGGYMAVAPGATAGTPSGDLPGGPVEIAVECIARMPPTPLAADLGDAIAAAAAAHGEEPLRLASGAGHDAMVAARVMPAAMMFVPSIGGISHNVRENTSEADIVFGCEVLADAVAQLRRRAW